MENLSLLFSLFNFLTIFWFKIGIVEGIAGGQKAMIGEYQYVVSVESNGEHICNGAIVNELNILTAANCVIETNGKFKNKKFSILAGTNSHEDNLTTGIRVNVERIFVPKEYEPNRANPSSIYYRETGDLAILRVESPLDMGNIPKLNLPKKIGTMYPTFFNEKVVVAGFGAVAPKHGTKRNRDEEEISSRRNFHLRFANAMIIHKTACKQNFPFPLEDKHICGHVDQEEERPYSGVCDGDIGAPLVCGTTVIGILAQIRENCDEHRGSSLYTRVSSFSSFLKKALAGKRSSDMRIAVAGNQRSQSHGVYTVEVTL